MEQSKMMSHQEQQNVAGQAMESLGIPADEAEGLQEPHPGMDFRDELPLAAKERLGRQEKRHQKEMRMMQSQLQDLHARLGSQPVQNPSQDQQPMNGYTPQPTGGIEDHISRAVNAALQAKDQREQAAQHAEKQAHVHKQYQKLQDHLDNASSKYDDFEDVVRSPDAPFTDSMRDTALLLPNAADVLYKLGKAPDELKRISQLHPLEQAKEMIRLSVQMQGGDQKGGSAPRSLGNIKSNPVSAPDSANENTSVGELRRKLKAGWK